MRQHPKSVDIIQQWTEVNKIKLNVKKTKHMYLMKKLKLVSYVNE